MQVKEIDINTEKSRDMEFAKKKYKISFLGGPTTPTYSIYIFITRWNIYYNSAEGQLRAVGIRPYYQAAGWTL